LLSPAPEGVKVLGPAPAAVARVKTEYRFQMLLKTANRARLNEVLGLVRAFTAAEKWNPAMLAIDVDPMTLL
jgi:primosomal protein N' (replication factor Y)